jgi:hypothetical protein
MRSLANRLFGDKTISDFDGKRNFVVPFGRAFRIQKTGSESN